MSRSPADSKMVVLGGADMPSASSAGSLPVVTLVLDEVAESEGVPLSSLSVWLRLYILGTLGAAGVGGFGSSLRKKVQKLAKGFVVAVVELWRFCRSEGGGSRYVMDLRLCRSSSSIALVDGWGTS